MRYSGTIVMHKTRHVIKQIHWKKVALGAAIAIPFSFIVVQLIYPFNRTMLYAQVNNIAVGGVSREDAASVIKSSYEESKLAVYFGDAKEPYRSPTLKTLGVSVDTSDAVNSIMYPVWLRLIPTSLWWGHFLVPGDSATVSLNETLIREYAEREFGESCNITPKNATVVVGESGLSLSPAADGGTCQLDAVVKQMSSVKVATPGTSEARVALEGVSPKIKDEAAQQVINTIEPRLKDGVKLKFEKEEILFDAGSVRSWLVFNEDKDAINVKVDPEKAASVLNEKLKEKANKTAGSLTIKMKDDKEVSRSGNDTVGRLLNIEGTAGNITEYLLGKKESAEVAVTTVKPQIKYERSYTNSAAGFSAMIRRFAESNPGVYGVSLVELSGQRRTVGYNDTRNFFPASTYKLFVAFSTLKRVEAGTYKWSDKKVGGQNLPGGKNLSECFDLMIVNSDNACAEALRDAITYGKLNQDLRSIGIYSTSFVAPGEHKSTARDLTAFLVKLETGSLPISGTSRSKLLGVMKRNVYRSGVPSGASGAVADKVGFIWNLLHDAAIVYSPKGTYALTIMTDGSSWGNIAKLTKEIEKFRAQ